MQRVSYLMCNKCQSHGCTARPESSTFCSGYIKPEFIKKNTIFDNLMYKSAEQAETTLRLLHNNQISWQRYTK